jgi:hypothetical protein
LEEHQEERPKHYPAQCHFCRRQGPDQTDRATTGTATAYKQRARVGKRVDEEV